MVKIVEKLVYVKPIHVESCQTPDYRRPIDFH